MTPMMSDKHHPNSIRQFAIQHMEWKALQVGPMQPWFYASKPVWIRGGNRKFAAQLVAKLRSQPSGYGIIILQGFDYILRDCGMILNSHSFRPASTRRQNSLSLRG